MAFAARIGGGPIPGEKLVVAGQGVYLRPPVARDYAAWASLREQSREFLKPWEPTWPMDDLSRAAFRRRLRFFARAIRFDEAYPLFVFAATDGVLVGGCTLSNVRRGIVQTASLGYWVGAPFARQGFMTAALRALIPFAFDTLGLHRLEAACLAENEASRRLLLKSGFRQEGCGRGYLRIDGCWRDHQLFAILSSDPRP